MAYYLVKYRVGDNNEYIYPQSVTETVWKSATYHHTEHTMIGETEQEVVADGKVVVELKQEKAQELIEEYRSSYPTVEEDPSELLGVRRR